MKKLERLREFYKHDIGSPIDAILFIGGIIVVFVLILGIPTFLKTFYREFVVPIWNIKIGDVFTTILGAMLLVVLIIIGYKIQYKIEGWWRERKNNNSIP